MAYPHYRRLKRDRIGGRAFVVEDLSGKHCRLYLADRDGQLRLIFINDNGRLYALSDASLARQFGVIMGDLGLQWAAAQRLPFDSLDDLCDWPPAIFPYGPPTAATPKTPPY